MPPYGAAKENGISASLSARPRELRLTDALNNPLPLPTVKEDHCTLTLGHTPQYLSGINGGLLACAARHQAILLATALTEDRELTPWLDAAFRTLLDQLIQAETIWPRDCYLELLRAFPELERRWRNDELPRAVAGPVIAQLAQITRAMATAEEARQEPFLDPIPETLGDCEDYLSQYLTSSVGNSKIYERGDWLLKEVRRLMEEVEELLKAKRRIEAAAVAALANWRARGLTHIASGNAPKPVTAADFDLRPPAPPQPTPPAPQAPQAVDEAAAAPDARAPAAEPAPEAPEGIVHVVARGDNLSKIANKYKVDLADIMKWNKLTKRSVLNIGDKILIRP